MTPAAPPARLVAAIVHPVKADAKLRRQIERAAERAGVERVLWLETSEDDPGQGPARDAVAAGADLILAVGGDGTLRAVAEGIRGSGVPLGIIPLGTGNLFAHNLDPAAGGVAPVVITTNQAIKTALTGVDRAVDIGVIEIERANGRRSEHVFLVMAGIGIDAQMIANTTTQAKKAVGVLAYVGGIARSLRNRRRIHLVSRVDDSAQRTLTVHSLLIGNCGLLPGNIPLLPDARLDDGRFDIVTLRPKGFLGWFRVWRAIFIENAVLRRSSAGRRLMDAQKRRVRALRYEQGQRVSVRLERPDDIELDGDHLGKVISFTAQVDPGGIIVRASEAPRSANAPLADADAATPPARRGGSRAASRAPR